MKTNNSLLSLLFIFLFSALNSLAQSPKNYLVEMHPEFKTDEREIPEQYIGSNENGHYFLYSKGKFGLGVSSIVKFDTNFEPTKEKIILTASKENPDDLYDNPFESIEESLGVIKLNDQLLNITSISTKQNRKFFAKSIDLKNFKITSQKEIANIEFKGNNVNKSYMSFIVSKDSSSVGLFYTIPTKKKENQKCSLIVFDKEFNKINHYNYEFPFVRDQFVIMKGVLLNKDEMLILSADLSKMPANPNSKRIPDYNYSLHSLKQGKSTLLGKIPNDNKWLNNLNIVVTQSSIKFIGLYSNVSRFGSNGIFFHQIDRANNKLVIHKLSPFNEELLDRHAEISKFQIGYKKRIKKFKELPYYIPQSTLKYDDGSVLLIAEQVHTITQYVTSYYFENLIALMIDNNGNVQWSKMIKKDNIKTGTWIYSSFVSSKNNDDYLLIFNGISKNKSNNYSSRFHNSSVNDPEEVLLVVLNKSGTVNKKVIATSADTEGYRIRPALSSLIKENEILLFSQKPGNIKNQRFMSLKISE